jgi:hypothetical protein
MGSGFQEPGNPKSCAGSRVLAFLGTGNPLGFLAPDVPKPGFRVHGNPEPTVEFAFPGSREREPEPDTPSRDLVNEELVNF